MRTHSVLITIMSFRLTLLLIWSCCCLPVIQAAEFDPEPVTALLELLIDQSDTDPTTVQKCLDVLAAKIESRELDATAVKQLAVRLQAPLEKLLSSTESRPIDHAAVRLAVGLQLAAGKKKLQQLLEQSQTTEADRAKILNTLLAVKEPGALNYAETILTGQRKASAEHHAQVLAALGQCDDARVATIVLSGYAKLAVDNQPKAIELLTQRPAWAKALLSAIQAKSIPATAINTNQVTRLLNNKDAEIQALVKSTWGQIRTERNPQREQVIAQMRNLIRHQKPGNATNGEKVFARVCAQCHKLHGHGQEVGPDITLNGRNSFEQLLSNVFDPSLVIGAAYQSSIVETSDGRSLTGLVAENNDQRVVLKIPGGKTEIIPRADIESMHQSKLSLMPEELEKQLTPVEVSDLFAYLTLDKPPSDPTAKRLPGVYEPLQRDTNDPTQFPELVGTVAPGFNINGSGEGGIKLLAEYRGQKEVLQTHPLDKRKPAVMTGEFVLVTDRPSELRCRVSHHAQGDWELVVIVNNEQVRVVEVSKKTCPDGWLDVVVDLQKWGGKTVKIELQTRNTGWAYEFGYWQSVEVAPVVKK
jgi:putative heme-binding domain-containing protein